MMLIICDSDPKKAVDYLIEHTNKQFVFKQLLEAGQLICSVGISDEFKPVKQGKELQEWILKYPCFTFDYAQELFSFCQVNINMKDITVKKFRGIFGNLGLKALCTFKKEPSTAIFRYKKGYKTDIPTNTLLPIDKCCEEYKKYLDWKMRKQ